MVERRQLGFVQQWGSCTGRRHPAPASFDAACRVGQDPARGSSSGRNCLRKELLAAKGLWLASNTGELVRYLNHRPNYRAGVFTQGVALLVLWPSRGASLQGSGCISRGGWPDGLALPLRLLGGRLHTNSHAARWRSGRRKITPTSLRSAW